MNERILIVEEEQRLAGLLRDYLARDGYDVAVLQRGDELGARLRDEPADLVLLGASAPGTSARDLCKALRAASPGISIIMVSAGVEDIDPLPGPALGVDDYVCEPFTPREVAARIKAALRRRRRGVPPDPGLALHDAGYKALLHGRDLRLTALEYRLLKLLALHPGRIYTRDQLIDAMYRGERAISGRAIDSHVKKIRRKIAQALPGREIIHSLYGVGYKYEW